MTRSITLHRATREDYDEISRFSVKMYGGHAYQGLPQYLRWLYEENPAQIGQLSGWIARSSSRSIVGIIHTMAVPFQVDGRELTMTSLQNLIVEESLTQAQGGTGFLLLRAATRGCSLAIAPGVAAGLADAYRRMRYPEIRSAWFRNIVAPQRLMMDYLRCHAGNRIKPVKRLAHGRVLNNGWRVEPQPTRADIRLMVQELRTPTGVNWTEDFFAWRYFHPQGPFHVVVAHPDGLQGGFLIVSVGLRHFTNVTRLMETNIVDPRSTLSIAKAVTSFLGATMLLAYETHGTTAALLKRAGWKSIGDAVSTFGIGKAAHTDLRFSPGATDLGFEALLAGEVD